MSDLRVTDRDGVVHIVVDRQPKLAVVLCGKSFKLGSGTVRVWQAIRGHQHEVCHTCLELSRETQ